MKYAAAQSALAFAATREPQPGDFLGGVTLGDEIGRGGMARVFRGHHERLGVDVAVKVLLKQDENSEVAERFAVEAHALAKLDSPHIVRVLDFGLTDAGAPFVVTELLGGQNLAERLLGGPLSVEETLEIVSQIASALEVAHRAGVIHRDVKPSNIHFVETGRVKLLDFGAAKSEAPLKAATTSTGLVIGTPLYMSPEQLTSPRKVDARADVWSLAVVAFELLAGRRPFEAETVGELAIAQTKGLARHVSSDRPALRSFDATFARAFHPDVTKRQTTATELRDDLVNALKTSRRPQLARTVLPISLALTVGLAASIAWAVQTQSKDTATLTPEPALVEDIPARPFAAGDRPAPIPSANAQPPGPPDARRPPTNAPTIRTTDPMVDPIVARSPVKASLSQEPPPVAPALTPSAKKDRGF